MNRPLLHGDMYCSFQSLLFPSYYLRVKDFKLHLDQYQDTDTFKTESTFTLAFGFLNDPKLITVTIEPMAYPGMYLDSSLKFIVPELVSSAKISFFLDEVRPEMSRRKRRNFDEL